MTEPADMAIGQRVRSPEYGTGKIVADLGAIGVQVLWDSLPGVVGPWMLLHDRVFVERLERI